MTNLTAQLFPVARLSRLARSMGIVTIVYAADALGQFPFKLRELDLPTPTASACTNGC